MSNILLFCLIVFKIHHHSVLRYLIYLYFYLFYLSYLIQTCYIDFEIVKMDCFKFKSEHTTFGLPVSWLEWKRVQDRLKRMLTLKRRLPDIDSKRWANCAWPPIASPDQPVLAVIGRPSPIVTCTSLYVTPLQFYNKKLRIFFNFDNAINKNKLQYNFN